ncbi:MAG TPA: ABC transporter substrate-binding protein [Xanthobacteraceae bacterium]|nr:ABC transporter substrate-binding protein [Xanthobacteraceae bacterium]
MNGIGRRAFISLLAGAAAWPLAARAQQRTSKIPRIGIIDDAAIWDHFRQGLRELGYVEGQTVAFEYRSAEGKPDRLAAAANELVRVPVDVIVTYGTAATAAAKRATTAIPIVMVAIGDPVRSGLVASLARPGGNITGNTILGPEIAAKRLQLFKEVIPSISRLAFLWNPNNASHAAYLDEWKSAAPALGVKMLLVAVGGPDEFDSAFSAMMRERPDGFTMTADPMHQLHIDRIIDFLAKNRLPAMYQVRENVIAGAFMSYGASLPDLSRRGAAYVHRILQGAKPAELPVEQPVKFDLSINLKTARALGIEVPPMLLARADEVIE